MNERKLTEAQARALWERAARLHAEASARELTAGGSGDPSPVADEGNAGEYTVDVVVRSAIEAGIPAEFVERALADVEQEGAESSKVDGWAADYFGDDTLRLSVRRTIDAPPDDVYAAMQRVLPNDPFALTLAGTDGRPPLEGGALRFEIPYVIGSLGGSGHQAVMDLRHWADIKEIHVRLTPHERNPGSTDVEMWASLSNTRRVNYWVANTAGAFIGGVAGLLGGLVASAVVDPVTAAQVAGVFGAAGVSALGTFTTSRLWWRPMYRLALRRGRRGMERLLDALVVDLQTGGAFTRRVGGGPDAKDSGDDPLAALLGS